MISQVLAVSQGPVTHLTFPSSPALFLLSITGTVCSGAGLAAQTLQMEEGDWERVPPGA